MTGFNPLVVDLSGGNLVLVVIVLLIALGALGMAVIFRKEVLSAAEGTDNMKNIAHAVQEGANAYLQRQFRTLGGLRRRSRSWRCWRCPPTTSRCGSSARSSSWSGAGFSASIGYLGMSLAVQANLRVAAAANTVGPRPGHEDRLPHRRLRGHGDRRPRPARRLASW